MITADLDAPDIIEVFPNETVPRSGARGRPISSAHLRDRLR
jgi:hypothetical protein